jgi:serine/threonine-protein kinase
MPSPPSEHDDWIGAQLDDYRIERLLGRGGMAAVYLAHDGVLDRKVAVKILPQGPTCDPELVKRFEREARIVARVNHPNIAQVYRIGEAHGCPYYAMEFIDGRSLAEVLEEKGRLTAIRTVDYAIQVCKGLRAAAEHDIIHRDIKPGNLMLTRDGTVKIVDFGIAKVFRDDTFQTQTGAVIGTPRYMAPEQGKGLAVDHRSDIYALGATAYHLLTGHPPFMADTTVSLIMQHIQKPVPPIVDDEGRVPARLCNVIYGMMTKEPERRLDDYTQLIEALEKVFQDAGPIAADEAETLRPLAGFWKPLIAIGVGLAILTVGATMFLPRAGGGGDEEVVAERPVRRVSPQADPTLRETMSTLRDIRAFREELRGGEPER